MPYARVHVETRAGQQRLARVRGRFEKIGVVIQGPIRELVADFMEQQFVTEGEAGGEPWAELKSSTLSRKRALGLEHAGILQRHGKLREILTNSSPSNPYIEMKTDGKRIRWTATHRVASRHQTGTPGGRMVARPLVPEEMPPEFMDDLRNIVTGYVLELGIRKRKP